MSLQYLLFSATNHGAMANSHNLNLLLALLTTAMSNFYTRFLASSTSLFMAFIL